MTTYDGSLIQKRIKWFSKSLLELGAGNPLLHFPFTSGQGKLKANRLVLAPESLDTLFQNLLSGKKAVLTSRETLDSPSQTEPTSWEGESSFDEEADWGEEDDFHVPARSPVLELGRGEFVLKVGLRDTALEPRLLELMRHATGLIEESGVNGLFLGLGRLEWYEVKKPLEPRLSPLILIPVRLERDLKRGVLRLVHTGDDVQLNATLEVKLGSPELKFAVPLDPVLEDFLPSDYLDQLSELCLARSSWRVHQDAFLGFFNPSKMGLYRELEGAKLQSMLSHHPILGPLLGRGKEQALSPRSEIDLRDPAVVERSRHVLDADGSQAEAVWRSALGEHLVLEGPPGTGKSQTITNIIATAVSQGKRVLFVAEKEAALTVVEERLKRVGLGDACLALHSRKANKKGVRDSLKRALEASRKRAEPFGSLLSERNGLALSLEGHAQATNAMVGSSGLSAYQLHGQLLAFNGPEVRTRPLRLERAAQWDAPTRERLGARVAEYQHLLEQCGRPQQLPHWGSARLSQTASEDEQLERLGKRFAQPLEALRQRAQQVHKQGFPLPGTLREWYALEAEWNWLRGAPDLSEVVLERALWQSEKAAELVALCERSAVHQSFAQQHPFKLGSLKVALGPLQRHLDGPSPLEHLSLKVLEAYTHSLQTLQSALSALLEKQTALDRFKGGQPEREFELSALLTRVEQLSEQDFVGMTVESQRWLEEEKALGELLETGKRQQAGTRARADTVRPELWEADLIGVRQTLEHLGHKWYRSFSGAYRKAMGTLKHLYVLGLPTGVAAQLEDLDALRRVQTDRQQVQRASRELTDLFGNRWKGLDSDWDLLEKARFTLTEQARAVRERRAPLSSMVLLEALSAPKSRLELLELVEDLRTRHQRFLLAANDTTVLLARNAVMRSQLTWAELSAALHTVAKRLEEQTAFLRSLNQLFEKPAPLEVAAQRELLQQLSAYQLYVRELIQVHPWASAALGSRWKGLGSPFGELSLLSRYLVQTAQRPEPTWQVLARSGRPDTDIATFQLSSLASALMQGMQALLEWLQMPPESLVPLEDLALEDLGTRVQRWYEDLAALRQTVAFNLCQAALDQEGLSEVWLTGLNWEAAASHLKAAFEFTACERLLERAFAEQPALTQFNRLSFEVSLERFRQLDLQLLEKNALQVLTDYQARLPALSGLGQMRTLENEMNKQRKLLPIRRLMTEAGGAIQLIKPVFMMSPLSIASFLPLGALEFDLVLFDEASQVRPEMGLGALLRAKQAIVVGDSNQMGPSNAFGGGHKQANVDGDSNQMDPSNAFGGERKEDGPEDATLYLESQSIQAAESLLDLFSSQFAHFKSRLTWHYRSKHESLIATSNAAFYDGALTTFPAAANKPGELGLVYHHLPHTVYIPGGAEPEALENAPRRGLKAVNPLEAEAIVRAAMHHASTRPWESLAVVAFSLSQQQMIYRQLERFQPQMSAQQQQFLFPDEDAHERFVVKNLENVQGDERDVIYISVGYGRTAKGKLTGNFGTLNRADGWRSLNVLITRAKKRCEVFVNFEPEEIPNLDDKKPDKSADQNKRLGLKTFRDFLVRARAMSQPQASQATSSGTEATELSSQVASTLETWGYRVAQQVGSSQDRIDLAVYHPERRDEFILGIVCDGPHYARSRWTRDRDRIRPQVLGAMGWQLYALWSTDWYRDPHGERDRLLEHLGRIVRGEFEAALQDVEPSTDLTDWTEVPESEAWVDFDPDPASVDPIDWEVAPPTFRGAALFPAYQTSPLQVEVLELHSVAPSKIAGWLVDIVEFEGPLHRDQLARRLLQAAGVRKLGNRIQSAFEQGLNHALFHLPEGQGLRQEGEFIFGRTLPLVRDRSALPQNEKQFEYISDPELDGALKVLTEQAIGIEVEELATGCARAFGFERTTQDVRVRIEQRVDVLLTQGVFTLENDFLSLKPVAVL